MPPKKTAAPVTRTRVITSPKAATTKDDGTSVKRQQFRLTDEDLRRLALIAKHIGQDDATAALRFALAAGEREVMALAELRRSKGLT